MNAATNKPLTLRQIDVLRVAPIGVDDASNGDPYKGGCFIYHGADGRIARSLWLRGLLQYDSVNPHNSSQGGLLRLSAEGRSVLEEALALQGKSRSARGVAA